MHSRSRHRPSLLGEAFALKESTGWAEAEDGMQIQRAITQRRRKVMLTVFLATLILGAAVAVVVRLF